jgi:hypothetical protein
MIVKFCASTKVFAKTFAQNENFRVNLDFRNTKFRGKLACFRFP